jgi:hypothetical protein
VINAQRAAAPKRGGSRRWLEPKRDHKAKSRSNV